MYSVNLFSLKNENVVFWCLDVTNDNNKCVNGHELTLGFEKPQQRAMVTHWKIKCQCTSGYYVKTFLATTFLLWPKIINLLKSKNIYK